MAKYPCYGCLPPKRTTTCKFDGTCDEYSKAKAKHDKEKAIADQKKAIECGLVGQALKGINRAKKARKRREGKR